jgi:hypothetical protein
MCHPQQGAFARAISAHQSHTLTLLHLQMNAMQSQVRVKLH